MIKNIITLSLFVVSWSISAMEKGFIELFPQGSYVCKGRYYIQETPFNCVSPCSQKLWTYQDPVMDLCNSLEDALEDYEYNALKVHTCSVTRKEGYFSNMLIAKLEINPRNQLPRRTLETFLAQAISLGGTKIYAWVDQENVSLCSLLAEYRFEESSETLFIPHTSTQVSPPSSNIIQLEVNIKNIHETFCR